MFLGLIIFSFLAAFLVLVPLPWQWRIKNYPVICLIIWLFIYNMITAVNAILWSGTARLQHVAWCEITTRVEIAINFAIPATLLCISVKLERVSSFRPHHSWSRLYTAFELFMSVGFPVIMAALYYVIQTHRFAILEDVGCRIIYFASWNGLFFMDIFPLILSVVSAVFAGIAAVRFIRWRNRFAKHLSDNSHSMTMPSFVRLMFMSFMLMSACVVMFSLYIWVNVQEGLGPNLGFKAIHRHFGVIPLIPKIVLTPFQKRWAYGLLWAPPISTIVVFGFYTMNREAAKDYRPLFSWLSRCLPPKLLLLGSKKDKSSSAHQLLSFGSNATKTAFSHQDQKGVFISTTSYTTDLEGCVLPTKPSPIFVGGGTHSPTSTEKSL